MAIHTHNRLNNFLCSSLVVMGFKSFIARSHNRMYNHLCSSLVAIAINYVEITKFPSNIRAPSRTEVPVCMIKSISTMGRTGVGGTVVGGVGLAPYGTGVSWLCARGRAERVVCGVGW